MSKTGSKILIAAMVTAAVALSAGTVWGYKLIPVAGGEDPNETLNKSNTARKTALAQSGEGRTDFLEGISAEVAEMFGSSVHENLTGVMYCPEANCEAPPTVIEGVRWNDNPTFRHGSKSFFCTAVRTPPYIDFATGTSCWLTLFYDAEKKARQGVQFSGNVPPDKLTALIYRVHYGDLQFFHSMGSWDGEPATDTRDHILAWAQYTYNVASDNTLSLDKPITVIQPTLSAQFKSNGFSTRQLFSPTNSGISDEALRDKVFGSLLHMIEDSFSTSHVDRDNSVTPTACNALGFTSPPGVIHQFYSYNRQDSSAHGGRDEAAAVHDQAGTGNYPVETGQKLIALRAANKPWSDVEPLFQCLYGLADDQHLSAAGPGIFVLRPITDAAWYQDEQE
jgi:hypothetical protein